MSLNDLIIALAYFSIPMQMSVALFRYQHFSCLPRRLVVLLVLFVLFISLCGLGHLSRCLGYADTPAFHILNALTALVSLATALYLPPQSLDGVENFIKLNEETAESKRKLMTLTSFLCHEIRNPLWCITSTVSTLEDEPMTREQEKCISAISQSADLMLRLVNDVLDIRKLESGKLELEDTVFDLHRLLEGLVTSHTAKLKTCSVVSFRAHVASDVPRIVAGDATRIQQIAGNLLSNALKFTQHGGVDFSVTVVDTLPSGKNDAVVATISTNNSKGGRQNNQEEQIDLLSFSDKQVLPSSSPSSPVILQLTVSDTGIGIPPEMMERIFQPYSQEKLTNYREHGGTGLGLSIVSKLTEIMGGSINAMSSIEKGSTFTVYLPVSRVNEQEASDFAADVSRGETSSTVCSDVVSGGSTEGVATLDIETGCSADHSGIHIHDALGYPPHPPAPPPTAARDDERHVLSPALKATKKLAPFALPADGSAVVLVVDDNAINRKILGKMLLHFNLQCEYACNGQEAVDAATASRNYTGNAQRPHYSMILMDLCMPVMDGFEAMREIRNTLKLDVPIIALTANAVSKRKEEAIDAGATEFATKPILRADLHAKCQEYLSKDKQCRTSLVL